MLSLGPSPGVSSVCDGVETRPLRGECKILHGDAPTSLVMSRDKATKG